MPAAQTSVSRANLPRFNPTKHPEPSKSEPFVSMILVCPACETRYKVDDTSLGEAGRQVKCARCGNVWHAEPNSPEPPPMPVDPLGDVWTETPPAENPDDRKPPPAPAADLSVERHPPPMVDSGSKRSNFRAGWLLLCLAIAGIALTGYTARDQVIAAWPPATKLYDALGLHHNGPAIVSGLAGGGLVLENVESIWDTVGEQVSLTVRGTLVNHSNVERPVPLMVIWLAAEDDRELQSWRLVVEAERLAPDESVEFETSIDDPAEDATRIEIAAMPS